MMDASFLAFVGGPVQAFVDSDLFGQLIVLVQIGMSVISWAAMFNSFLHLRERRQANAQFVDDFICADDPLRLFCDRRYPFEQSPMGIIYLKTCERLAALIPQAQRLALQSDSNATINLGAARMELVETTCAHTTEEEVLILNKGMTVLSIMTSSAPLLGLFGTVWGVMLAFQAMAASGSADIASLAPGISSALLTTVVGLFVAIPSTIAYSTLQSKIEEDTIQVEGFADELMGKLTLNYRASEGN